MKKRKLTKEERKQKLEESRKIPKELTVRELELLQEHFGNKKENLL